MTIAAVLCLCAAVLSAVMGVRSLVRPATELPARAVRAVAPTQLAAAVIFAAGGVVGLSGRSLGLLVLCVVGAIATVAVGAWQGARYAHAEMAATPSGGDSVCGRSGGCGGCSLSCQ